MKSSRMFLAAGALLACAAAGFAQEKKPSPAAPAAPALPRPGPEHAILKDHAGAWDATVESFMAPGQPPVLSKGTEMGTMVGDFWLVSDFKTDMLGQPFTGHGTMGYDPARKKYVSTWVDSMTPALALGESDYDAATRTFTGWIDGLDYAGQPTKIKTVTVWKDPTTRVFTMSLKGPDGKDTTALRITYTRRK
ncbi:MAG TPA: DUF1579 domain-containing protein [Vicinamibacteria bacterium]|nr:DUF1579 domain-containing protein [Vicinamibacteria bacterium]